MLQYCIHRTISEAMRQERKWVINLFQSPQHSVRFLAWVHEPGLISIYDRHTRNNNRLTKVAIGYTQYSKSDHACWTSPAEQSVTEWVMNHCFHLLPTYLLMECTFMWVQHHLEIHQGWCNCPVYSDLNFITEEFCQIWSSRHKSGGGPKGR